MTEEWKDLEGYEGWYQISNLGRVKSLSRVVPTGIQNSDKKRTKEKILRQFYIHGYCAVNLYKDKKMKSVRVHRLVAKAFIPNPYNYPCVNHKDENRKNSRADNLEWYTHQYNSSYGTLPARLSAKLKCHPKMSIPIKQLDMNGNLIRVFQSYRDAVRHTGLNRGNLWKALNGIYTQCGGFKWQYL